MSKDFEEYIADKTRLNLASKEEVSLIKIKLGKSHRKESDWEVIKGIFQKRNFITFIPAKNMEGITSIRNIPCVRGYLIVFLNIDDCTQYIRERRRDDKISGHVPIIAVPSGDVWETADQYGRDILIDVNERSESKCFLYSHKEKLLKAVIMTSGSGM